MKNFIDDIKKPEMIKADETLMQHDIKLLELDQRVRSLENLLNAIHNEYPVWWGKKDQS